MLNRPAIILSDLHLGPASPGDAASSAASVIQSHPGHEVFFLGDSLDLSLDPPKRDPAESVATRISAHRDLRDALRDRLQQGITVALYAGNHDAQLIRPEVRARLVDVLGLNGDAPLQCGVWCMNRSGIHFEHGNLYDPDNATTHPLVAPSVRTEPLGVALMRQVLAPTGSLFFAHAHEMTPWAGLSQAFIRRGLGAPALISRYYYEAVRIVLRAQPRLFESELQRGAEQLRQYAAQHALDVAYLEQLLGTRAHPRHHDRNDAFFRLYLDRSLATLLWCSFGVAATVTAAPLFMGLSGAGLAYLGASLSKGKSRYSGKLVPLLREAAKSIRKLTGARAVVFGHTHVEEDCPGYINIGSFGYGGPQGRSYLLLDATGSLHRLHVGSSEGPRNLDALMSAKHARDSDEAA